MLFIGFDKVLSRLILIGISMPCKIIFVVQSWCGKGFFSIPKMLLFKVSPSEMSEICFFKCSIEQAKNPPVPQAGSRTFSPIFRVNHINNKLSYGTWSVVFSRVSCRLQALQKLFINIVKQVSIFR